MKYLPLAFKVMVHIISAVRIFVFYTYKYRPCIS